ncbi:DUF1003 domain-containing protein [Caulobacter sp. UNC279MFTsu5.1]|uniref:DUF1003 domain-containing protein n=1 Tax=Caulobacter sp. UNC279MFTsu5.1 TaxID=1502775 RepID=UPI00035CEB98|nr:DUF1003 domain-containing protein [Caulobacter sp. UNC279MFTsu5.1]SFK57600.1 Uncharacterized membrane protein [Caulobacter sp. UNC279MFTsu5.1]
MNETIKKLDAESRRLLGHGFRELEAEERRVILQIIRRAAIARNIADETDEAMTFGQRLADRVAEIGGSWGFIIGFGIFLAAWAVLNGLLLPRGGFKPFDPYPFIFLNLILSMVAAVQAPVIMMSQNRQASKDRAAAEHDYEVNLKAELEILALHEKLDALRTRELADMTAHLIILAGAAKGAEHRPLDDRAEADA